MITTTDGDRMIVLGALTLICAIAWAYLAYMGWGMAHMDVGATMAVMPQMVSWGPIDVALVFAMWSIMMVAMMLPSAAPTILLLRRSEDGLRIRAAGRDSIRRRLRRNLGGVQPARVTDAMGLARGAPGV